MSNPIPLEPGSYYHIYNRGNNRENLFVQERNYAYFMKLWGKYIAPVADTYAYCLLRNHFHAAVRVKDSQDLSGLLETKNKLTKNFVDPTKPSTDQANLTGLLVSQHFSNFFNAYARAFNLAVGRTGALFERPFERILIMDENYLARLIVYIHQNPQKHGFVSDFRDWPHSSYHGLRAADVNRLKRDEAMALFGGRRDFLQFHQEIQPLKDMEDED